ncbi:LolA family protein [Vibrio mangrovi]|uniref:Lipoprotein chaperone n=1 Tax=Vibrio mangrovi TaxID=474394 RepID=A0A1Y6IR25_9VIBR|nr:outer membrane lipoprotein carrier protein LolA [Vibrio mangrovi]MDW6001854.1 outer membrane lipoprotein carrier protein LolA [Vibrio mangrovi]SMS00119.1 lipoprotein chaperone [Vibrio mangrovi]
MIRFLFFCLLFVSPLSLAAVNTLQDLQHQLAQHPLIRGHFDQKRIMALFEQPLLSSGQFTLSHSDGLIWQQDEPFPVHLVLTQNKLQQTFADQPPQLITAQDNPMAFYFSHIFLAVFHGDTDQLTRQFTLTLIPGARWTLTLTPKSAPLDQVFDSIILSGQQYIDTLSLHEVRGDVTEMMFTQQSTQPETLTDAEKAQFNF